METVLGQIHFTQSARADFGDDPVMRQGGVPCQLLMRVFENRVAGSNAALTSYAATNSICAAWRM